MAALLQESRPHPVSSTPMLRSSAKGLRRQASAPRIGRLADEEVAGSSKLGATSTKPSSQEHMRLRLGSSRCPPIPSRSTQSSSSKANARPLAKVSVECDAGLCSTSSSEACLATWLEGLLRPDALPTEQGHVRTLSSSHENRSVNYEDITFLEPIGVGSYGAVWRASWEGGIVAVKQCKLGNTTDTEMLLKEIRLLQMLRHPRLVPFLGCCDHQPHILMLVEYMAGGSLRNLLFKREVRPEFKEQLRMAWQISEGLTYLHARGVVHRDLKTANIVLDEERNCRICDFGLTVTLERSHVTMRCAQGSPRYMAPEQFSSVARITVKVDIWQMGCVMLELFCFVVPLEHCNCLREIATELIRHKRPPAVPESAHPYARFLIEACLRISPKQRPAAASLEEALGGLWKHSIDAELRQALVGLLEADESADNGCLGKEGNSTVN